MRVLIIVQNRRTPARSEADVCGIAGRYQQADGQKLVDVMSERIAHRGPDAAGTWNYEDDRVSVQFGHRRLSSADPGRPIDPNPLGLPPVGFQGKPTGSREEGSKFGCRAGVQYLTSVDKPLVVESGIAVLRGIRSGSLRVM